MLLELCALSNMKCEGVCRSAHRDLERCPAFFLKKEEKKKVAVKRYRAESALEEEDIFKG